LVAAVLAVLSAAILAVMSSTPCDGEHATFFGRHDQNRGAAGRCGKRRNGQSPALKAIASG
jgi:hypothetical protein